MTPVEDEAAEAAPQPPVAHLLDRRGRLRLAYEPIADLALGSICGYEALERFPDPPPEIWRTEALRRGLEPDFDAFVVGSVLHARESLPEGCFLSLNVRAATLLREPVQRVLARAGELDGLVIELSPRVGRREEPRLLTAVGELRMAGARFAIDDVGGEDAVLRPAGIVRPEYAKLSPLFVAGLHRDPARRALLDALGRLAGHFGTSMVAQGVARVEEVEALLRLRVRLAQGPLVGVRAKTLTPVAFPLSAYARERGAAMLAPGMLASLVEPLPEGAEPEAEALAMSTSSDVVAVARQAMLRPPEARFDPLVCRDAAGAVVGIVRVERLVEALADAAAGRPE